jgi:hypothetical protein
MSLPVGADIESICGKCGDVWHVVAAKVGDKVAKVVCKQCGQQHRYKPPEGKASANEPVKAARPAGAGSKSKKASSPRAAKAADAPLVSADPGKPPKVYKPTESFAPGDAITHPSFGTGVVELIPGPGKIQCFFPGGRKVLALVKAPETIVKPTARDENAGPKGPGDKPPQGL